MKAITKIAALGILVMLSSCYSDTYVGPQGPAGPQGPIGPQGASGENAFVFEWTDINFTAPDYEVILPYPDNFEGYDSDVAIVYLLWDSYTNGNNEVVKVWRQLSQTVISEQGTLVYNFDFSKYDTRLFLDAAFPRENLTANATDAWIARVVIVPGDFFNSGRMDFSDYAQVEAALDLPSLGGNRKVEKRF
ncbi:MAG: collagen-like protein [Cyclobacteriaceae bacterium]